MFVLYKSKKNSVQLSENLLFLFDSLFSIFLIISNLNSGKGSASIFSVREVRKVKPK